MSPRRGGVLAGLRDRCAIRDAVDTLNIADAWYPAIGSDGAIRDGAWVAEATDLVDLSKWPAGTRLILRKERPHPGARSCGSPMPTGTGSPGFSPTPPTA